MDKHPLSGWVMVICNPVSGGGRGLTLLPLVRRTLESAGVRYVAGTTGGRWHAAQLARSAVEGGCSAVIAIGGDGTLFEVVNGVMYPGEGAGDTAVGLVMAGRGSDFGRSLGIPFDAEVAASQLLEGRTRRVDLGLANFEVAGGRRLTRYFANAAGLGFDAEVAVRSNAGPRILGGTIPYLTALLTTLGRYRNKHVTVTLDDNEPWTARVNSVVIANGQFFGGGMKVAPDALLTDGELEVVVIGDFGKVELVRNVPRVYDGSHITHAKVMVYRARHVEVTSTDRMLLQADGEVLGRAPASLSIVPLALKFLV
ncbi:MAG TPA: diacylglycerol kinase family protein [Chloroflexia bacterium]|nr:diacylglycerol kinase family protein [Chloroflexia bacterium]